MPGDSTDLRDVVIFLKDGPLQRISEGSPLYQPMHYVLLFVRGEMGWHWNIPYSGVAQDAADNTEGGRNRVSQREYYIYRLHPRCGESNHIFRAQR